MKTNGTTTFVLKHPLTRRFYRFKEVEHFIVRQLDGATAPEVIQQRVQEQFKTKLSPRTLERFIETLRSRDLLQAPAAERPLAIRRTRGGILTFRIAAVDPDRLFTLLARQCRLLYSPAFVAFSIGLMALAASVTFLSWDEVLSSLPGMLSFETVVLAWIALLGTTVLHEFAHGVTLKHMGGEVRELGFLLIYFQPALYVNVSDAWLLPKRQKLWVMSAGAYFDAFVWAAATVVWRVTEPGTWISSVSLIVLVTSAVKTFLNLNPLIKLDGYYILSDLLEAPNLREKSFRYLRGLAGRLGAKAPVDRPSRRERMIYIAYGVLAAAYSISLLWLIAASIGHSLVERYQGAGFVVFLALVGILIHRPVAGMVRAVARSLCPTAGLLAMARWCLKMLILAGIAAGIAAVLFHCRMDLRVAGSFKVLPTHRADLRAATEGILEEILVDEGESVQRGDLVARLSARDLLAERRKLEAEIREKQAALRMLEAGPRKEESGLAEDKVKTARTRLLHAGKRYEEAKKLKDERHLKARTTVEKAEERLKYSTTERTRLRTLLDANIISPREFEEAEQGVSLRRKELEEAKAELRIITADDLGVYKEDLAIAREELREAQGALGLVRAGARPEEIEATQALIARLDAQRAHTDSLIELLMLTSPSDGVVITPKLKEKIGHSVMKGDLVAEIRELETTKVDIAVSEKDIGEVDVGQQVVLKARAFPGEVFLARVASIAPAAAPDGQWTDQRIILVTTEIDDPRGLLKPEMTGMAKISCGERRVIDVLTRRLARYFRVEFWSWW